MPDIDEHYAVGAAMQNILLTAHDDGLVGMIHTGPHPRIPVARSVATIVRRLGADGCAYPSSPHRGRAGPRGACRVRRVGANGCAYPSNENRSRSASAVQPSQALAPGAE